MISTDSIKFTISEQTNTILNKDAELFGFKKKNGSVNKNKFYLTIFMNYYDQFIENNQSIADTLSTKYQIHDEEKLYLLTEYVQNQTFISQACHESVSTRIKPTETTKYAIYEYINKFSKSSISKCFARLFTAYSSLPLNQRERIVFKNIFTKIEDAIHQKKKIRFITVQDKEHVCSPYSIQSSKEELFNYLFSTYEKAPHTNRINLIKHVEILNESVEFKEKDLECFNLSKFSPQYIITNPDEIIRVKFNKHGLEMYECIYLLRPQIYEIDKKKNIYSFKCSYEQAIQYFSKFWTNATVLSPKKVANSIQNHLEKTLENYKQI